jgi:hypothetical protein
MPVKMECDGHDCDIAAPDMHVHAFGWHNSDGHLFKRKRDAFLSTGIRDNGRNVHVGGLSRRDVQFHSDV